MNKSRGVARVEIQWDYFPYKDNGCGRLCKKSIECPYPVCIHDNPSIIKTIQRQAMAERIVGLRSQGMTIGSIGKAIGLSNRTIYRILAEKAGQML